MSELNNIKRENPFKVPENYFEQFNAGIMEQLPKKESHQRESIRPLWKKVVSWSAVAAVAAGVIVTIGVFNHGQSSAETNLTSSSANIIDSNGPMLASTADVEDFYMFLEDEAVHESYYDSFNVE